MSAHQGPVDRTPVALPEVGQLMAFRDPGGNPVLAMQYDLD